MTTVDDVARWLEAFAPGRLAEPWDNVGLLWGDPHGGGRAGHDLPDRDVADRPRSDRGAGGADRQPSSGPVQGGETGPGGPSGVRAALEAGTGRGLDLQPPHRLRQHARRDQRPARRPARPAGRAAPPAFVGPRDVQGGRLHPPDRSRRRPLRRVRRGGRPDRGLPRVLVHQPRPGDLLRRARGRIPPSANRAVASRSASTGSRWSARPSGSPRS